MPDDILDGIIIGGVGGAIAEDRVRYICSIHPKIKLSTGDNEDLWGIEQFIRGNLRSVPINPGL
jgi:hypothetical protein